MAPVDDIPWPILPGGVLPRREGSRPEVSWTIRQERRNDNAPRALQEELFAHLSRLPGVTSRQSAISVSGGRGLMLGPAAPGPVDAFLVPAVGEFAHLHPEYDGSLHVALPPALAADGVK